MKNIRAAYRLGTEGHPAKEKFSRVQHLAHRAGQKSLAKTVAINEAFGEPYKAQFAEAVHMAHGINQKALVIIEAAAAIPNQASSEPGWGVEIINKDGGKTHQWHTVLSSGPDQDPTRPHKTPVVTNLGSLRIDSTDWADNGFILPVDNLIITSTAPKDKDDKVGAATTEIHINTRPYDADAIVVDDKADFKDGVRIIVDPHGTITEFGMARSSSTGYVAEDPTKIQVNLGEFLEGVHTAVNDTVQTYQAIPEGM